ncbi:MAG TPA: glycosyltransferase family 1 protein [Chthoniobacterales bacterium]|nr:glycosyltransferase family 1 protein [Chthoniobacterales bacterium]
MSRIALNCRFTGTPQPTGTQTAAGNLFAQIVRAPSEFEFIAFADTRFPGLSAWKELPRVTVIETPFQDWSRGRAQLWEQLHLPMLIRRWKCQVAHHPINTSPAWSPGARAVVTLHDLNFLRADWYPLRFRAAYSLCTLPGLRQAARVVTISNYVRDRAREQLSVSDERLRMIYNGVKPMAAPSTAPGGPGRYIVCVGSIPPHKNLARLIKAFLLLRSEFPDLELRVVGRPMALHARDPELPALLEAEGVRVLGYLSEEELAGAYAHAQVFCYPSLEEGFGLPLLEAMSLGCPVVTSNVSCLPEVAGPAAILVDPYSPEAIAEGLRKVLTLSPQERSLCVEQGHQWVGRFSWDAAAQHYLNLYRELI